MTSGILMQIAMLGGVLWTVTGLIISVILGGAVWLAWRASRTLDREPDAPAEPDVIFEGATGLPDNSEEALWTGLQHWCNALTEIRHALPDAEWHVHVDDHDIPWDPAAQAFDPTQ